MFMCLYTFMCVTCSTEDLCVNCSLEICRVCWQFYQVLIDSGSLSPEYQLNASVLYRFRADD